MRDRDKTKDQLLSELVALRQKVSRLEASETRGGRVEDTRGQCEEWYRRIVDTAYEGVWVIDAEGKTEYVNRRMAETLGYSVEEMLGRSAFDFVYEADLAESEQRLERRKRGVGEQSEFRLRRKDGSELWVLANTNPILDESGEISGVLGMLTDTTERRQAEEKIHFQAQLLDAVGQAVIATDMQGTITYWNRCAEELYGWSAEEVIGRYGGEVLISEDQREKAAEIMSELKAGRSWSGEFVVRHRDGHSFPVTGTDTPVHDKRGNLVGTIGVCVDITERKQAEKRRDMQHSVSWLLAESISPANNGQKILRTIGVGLEWDYAGLWVVDPGEKMLRCISTWRAHPRSIELERASRRMRLAKGEALPGRAWGIGKPVWSADVAMRIGFVPYAAASSAGMRTGLAYPIRVGKKIVGVLELFSRRTRNPDKDSTAAMRALSSLIGQFIQRKRAEEELKRQMKVLRQQAQLLDLAHDAIMCHDMNGTITFWNRGAEEIYGWSREEALGENSRSLLKTRFPKPLEEIEEEILSTGRWEGELVHTKRDGTQVVVASRWALRRDGKDHPSAILEINSDITEHKQLKLREHEARRQLHTTLKALRESESRLKRLAEVNIIGVVAVDFSGNITEANEAFLQTIGYTHEDLLWGDLHWDELTPPEYRCLDEQAIEQIKRTGACAPYEKEYIRKDGNGVPVLVGAIRFEESQDSSIAFVLDLTERRRAEVPLEDGRAERRQVASGPYEEARKDLVAALQAMQDGQAELEDLEPDGSSGRRLLSRELNALWLADEGLRNAVSDLRMKRLDEGQPFVRTALSLMQNQTLLQDVEYLVELNRRIVPGCEIQLSVKDGFPPELPALTRLELLNILKEALVNARRHSKARCIRVTLGAEEDKYWAEVVDDGQGFEIEALQEGTGISEMRESAHSLGGELEVKSEPGGGTRVRVWVPF